jgi:hypothetical protein
VLVSALYSALYLNMQLCVFCGSSMKENCHLEKYNSHPLKDGHHGCQPNQDSRRPELK